MNANAIRVSQGSLAVDARMWMSVSWITVRAESVVTTPAASPAIVRPALSFLARADTAPVKSLLEFLFNFLKQYNGIIDKSNNRIVMMIIAVVLVRKL